MLTPNPGILDISPYRGGKAADLRRPGKLSANENPLGPSPKAVAAFQDTADLLHRYPEGGAMAVREKLSQLFGLELPRLICGTGSDEILTLMARAYTGPGDEVVFSEHGFLIYPIATLSAGATPVKAAEADYQISVDAILETITDRTKLVFIANPSNPTGRYIPRQELARLHAALPPHVGLVLDGAYAELVDQPDYDSGLALAREAENVVITRTFSKAYGLAGLRIGWAYGPRDVIDVLDRLRGPFNTSIAAQAAALAALDDQEWLAHVRAHSTKWRQWLADELTGLGFSVVPGVTNFLLCALPQGWNASALEAHLSAQELFIRRMEAYGYPDHVRVSVGTEDENRALIKALGEFG